MRTTKAQRAREDAAAVAGTGPRRITRAMYLSAIAKADETADEHAAAGRVNAAAAARRCADDSRARLASMEAQARREVTA